MASAEGVAHTQPKAVVPHVKAIGPGEERPAVAVSPAKLKDGVVLRRKHQEGGGTRGSATILVETVVERVLLGVGGIDRESEEGVSRHAIDFLHPAAVDARSGVVGVGMFRREMPIGGRGGGAHVGQAFETEKFLFVGIAVAHDRLPRTGLCTFARQSGPAGEGMRCAKEVAELVGDGDGVLRTHYGPGPPGSELHTAQTSQPLDAAAIMEVQHQTSIVGVFADGFVDKARPGIVSISTVIFALNQALVLDDGEADAQVAHIDVVEKGFEFAPEGFDFFDIALELGRMKFVVAHEHGQAVFAEDAIAQRGHFVGGREGVGLESGCVFHAAGRRSLLPPEGSGAAASQKK